MTYHVMLAWCDYTTTVGATHCEASDFFFHHDRGLNPDLTLEKLLLVLKLKTLCADVLTTGSDPLRRRTCSSGASTAVMKWSYCPKPVAPLHARSVLDLPKIDEWGVAGIDEEVAENVWSTAELDVDEENALDVLRFCKVEAAMPSELALATKSASMASSVMPGPKPRTSFA